MQLQLEQEGAPKNAILEAMRYQQCLDAEPERTRAEVAVMFGVSRARVTQYLNLLKLPRAVIDFLADCDDLSVLRYFTERRLRVLVSMGPAGNAVRLFRGMLQEAVSQRDLVRSRNPIRQIGASAWVSPMNSAVVAIWNSSMSMGS